MSSGLTTADVARVLKLPEARVREMVRAGLAQPIRRGRAYLFSFQDLLVLRTAQGLLAGRVPVARVKRALAALVRQLPTDRPLSGLRVYADGREVVVRDGRGRWHPETGQALLAFEVDEIEQRAGRVVPALRRERRPGAAGDGRAARPATGPSSRSRQEGSSRADSAARARASFGAAVDLESVDPRAARLAYQRAIAFDPTFADAYVNLGRLAYESGDLAEAARLYQHALEHAADDPITHYNLAMVLEDSTGKAESARAHYERAVTLDPTFADAHWNLGALCERLGRDRDALRHYAAYRRLTKRK